MGIKRDVILGDSKHLLADRAAKAKGSSPQPLLLGHRGLRSSPVASRLKLNKAPIPENSLAAFDFALAQGCDGVEFDVRTTADGRLIVCHDARLNRKAVATCNYAELQPPEAPPLCCLQDVLARFSTTAFLDIELKIPGLEKSVLQALRQHPPQRGYVVSSFLPDVVEALNSLDSQLPVGWICDRKPQLDRWRRLPIAVLISERHLASPALIQEVHAAGKKIFVWTVNQEREMLRFARLGVDAIISDDPERLCRTLRPLP